MKTFAKLVVAASFIFISGCSSEKEPDTIQLIAALSATPEHLMIDNGNASVWNDVKITINGEYVYESEIIPRGGTSLNLSEFTKGNGISFDPKKNRLRKVSIYVPDALDGKPGLFIW